MRIIECNIENFGKISNKKFDFKDGFNCIKGDNGSGKTTLATFIKVMLYGMSDTKKASLEENDRRHYLPWNKTVAKGTLTFTTGKKTYRIERSFGQKASDDTYTLYDTELGKVSDDFPSDIGTRLFGIDADGFERTVFLSERQLTPKSANKTISAKLSDLVGCDGDIGGLDEAIRKLEDARKFYYKKGGSGELYELEKRIAERRGRIEELSRIESSLTISEERRKTLFAELSSAESEYQILIKEREAAVQRAQKVGYESRLAEMKAELRECEAQKDALLVFFGGTPPTFEEINEAGYKLTESKAVFENEDNLSELAVSDAIREYFAGKCTDDDIEYVRSARTSYLRKEEIIKSAEFSKIKAVFEKRVPSVKETDNMLSSLYEYLDRKSSPIGLALGAIGFAIAAAAIILGILVAPLFFIGTLLGALVGTLAIFSAKNAKKKTEREMEEMISRFFSSLSSLPIPSISESVSALKELRLLIPRANELMSETSQEVELRIITDFVKRFSPEMRDALTELDMILVKHEKLSSKIATESFIREQAEIRRRKATTQRSEALAFISRYRTKTDDPLGELRAALTEYNRLLADIVARRREMTSFTNLHSLGELEKPKEEKGVEEINEKMREVSEKINSLRRDIALTEKTCRNYSDELEEECEVKIRLSELLEEYARAKENYDTVLQTKKYLGIAKDNMTAKYLGKTKESFEKYAKLISGASDAAFEMDTDFGVAKFEGASTHPTDAYSRGTKDLYNLAARLALIDSLYDGETPFIIFDDPFVSFDDAKAKTALSLLKNLAKSRQIIYFTCSQSRSS